MSEKRQIIHYLVILALASLCTLMFFATGIASSNAKKIKAEAVERGHAEWYPGKDGNPEWRWKDK